MTRSKRQTTYGLIYTEIYELIEGMEESVHAKVSHSPGKEEETLSARWRLCVLFMGIVFSAFSIVRNLGAFPSAGRKEKGASPTLIPGQWHAEPFAGRAQIALFHLAIANALALMLFPDLFFNCTGQQ